MAGLIFLYLAIFPFGKLLGYLPDTIILLLLIFNFKNIRLNIFVWICILSLIFSLSFFKLPEIFVGLLYLVRLISYVNLSQVVLHEFGKNEKKRKLIFSSLIFIGIFVAIFGWVQYFIFPDLRALKVLGWDDHYFRLASTFLDPAFTGIILVLTEILLIIKTIKNKSWLNYLLNVFLILTVLLTYSRSSFLALFFAVLFLFIRFREKFLLLLLLLFVFLIPILPKASSEGTNLVRTNSIGGKFINYGESLSLIKKSPIFGVGFNNVCVATTKNFSSHSCSGLDNSILFIIATTGIVGLIVFVQTIFKIIKNTQLDLYGWGLIASFFAIFIHGMFTDTFFYNFILGWVAILVGVTRRRRLL